MGMDLGVSVSESSQESGNEAAGRAANPAFSSWWGCLELELVHRDGGTQVARAYARAPQKFQRPFYPEGPHLCHGVMLHTAGGIVGGDRLSFNIHLHPQAQALLTTAAAGKIYRSPGPVATQSVQITVEAGGYLEWLPQETILFNGAQFHQHTRIDLGDDALWLGWDIVRLGRSARQETYDRGEWRSHVEVWRNQQPLWIDRQWVEGGGAMLKSPHGLGNCPVVGSFAVVGRPVSPALVEAARDRWRSLPEAKGEAGVTRLMEGLLCRYRGHSTLVARQWLMQVWDLVRAELVQLQSCRPRVWPL